MVYEKTAENKIYNINILIDFSANKTMLP